MPLVLAAVRPRIACRRCRRKLPMPHPACLVWPGPSSPGPCTGPGLDACARHRSSGIPRQARATGRERIRLRRGGGKWGDPPHQAPVRRAVASSSPRAGPGLRVPADALLQRATLSGRTAAATHGAAAHGATRNSSPGPAEPGRAAAPGWAFRLRLPRTAAGTQQRPADFLCRAVQGRPGRASKAQALQRSRELTGNSRRSGS